MAKKTPNTDGFDASSLRDFEDYELSLNSITNQLGKQNDIYKRIKTNLKDSKLLVNSIADKIEQATDLEDKHRRQIEKAAQAYKDSKKSITDAALQLKKREITQKEYNSLIIKARDNFKEVVSQIDTSNKSAKRTYDTLVKSNKELLAFADAAEKSTKKIEKIESIVDDIGGSGVEGVRELGDVLKSAANGGNGLAAALGAAAGVLAGMAYNYGLIGDKLGTIAGYDKNIAGLQGEIDQINQKVDMGMKGFGKRNFVMEEAMLQFNASLQQMGAQFQAASKTALFGNKLGSVGYGAAQLQLAGISADQIAEAMQSAADATGKMPTGKMGADMSIMAQRTGQSVDNIAQINDIFQRLDGISATTALNLQEGVRSMASKAGVNLAGAMTEIAEASKDAISYQIRSTSQLAKQVIYAKSLGVSFNEVAKAGQSMVLNYKDSIKAEMSLSAMLGKNVNLSEVRSKFMSGDQEGAMKALKAQGLNPKDMNMFQQQALQQALGGMDLNSIQKISERSGTTGGNLKEGSTEAGNKTYLASKQAAESGLAAANAMISAATELKSIALQAEKEQQRQDAIINNVGNIADKMNQIKQEEFKKNAETMLTTALIGIVVGLVTTYLASKGGSLFKGLGNLFKTSEKVAPKVASKTTAKVAEKTAVKAAEKTTAKAVEKTTAKVAEKVVAKTAGKALGKSLLKKIPLLGLGAGLLFAGQRAMAGDFAGAGLELASGAAGTIPGVGTAASVGIDAALAARDMGAFGGVPGSEPKKPEAIKKESKPTVDAVKETGKKQVEAQRLAVEKARVTLTETQYNTKLNQELVTLLGVNAQFLQQISENTAKDTSVNINGKVLNNTLLNQARRNYAVARTQ